MTTLATLERAGFARDRERYTHQTCLLRRIRRRGHNSTITTILMELNGADRLPTDDDYVIVSVGWQSNVFTTVARGLDEALHEAARLENAVVQEGILR